jgi:hypothetical protein
MHALCSRQVPIGVATEIGSQKLDGLRQRDAKFRYRTGTDRDVACHAVEYVPSAGAVIRDEVEVV